jgi:hypothetical protein
MKKIFTILKIAFSAFALFCMMHVNAQIVDLDPGKYYMIINHGTNGTSAERGGIGKNAIAIDDNHYLEDGAMVQQQERNQFMPRQLWQIVPVTDSTYYFINFGTGKALGLSTWRGLNPFWTGGAYPSSNDEKISLQAVPGFIWNGSQRAVVQHEFTPGDETQIWQPTQFPTNSVSGDTTFYRMTLAMNLRDSGFAFNVWERFTFAGFRNICIFPAIPFESSLYDDATSLYSYWFFQTVQNISSTGEFLRENINVFARDGAIVLIGELYDKQVDVFSILGTKVYSKRVNASELNLPVRQGLYIVKAGNLITKLVVQ